MLESTNLQRSTKHWFLSSLVLSFLFRLSELLSPSRHFVYPTSERPVSCFMSSQIIFCCRHFCGYLFLRASAQQHLSSSYTFADIWDMHISHFLSPRPRHTLLISELEILHLTHLLHLGGVRSQSPGDGNLDQPEVRDDEYVLSSHLSWQF